MAHEILIPRLGWSMEEGTFVGWLKQDGDQVNVGDAIFELEGEKASQEIEAVDEGILRIPATAPKPGTVLRVGAVIGYLVAVGESTPTGVAPFQSADTSAVIASAESPSAPSLPDLGQKRTTFASPRARRIAGEIGIDWRQLSGTGVNGRIREQDVRAAAVQDSSARESTTGRRIPLTNRRRVIAQRLMASRQQTVPVTLTTRADATKLVCLREGLKAQDHASPAPSYQDIITKLVAQSLQQHPLLAARFAEDAIVLPAENELHLGMAVDTEEGLLVPVIRNVAGLSLRQLAAESRRLAEQARAGTLVGADMQGAVFTITNLGALGIDFFTPVINAPETAILGLGAIRREAVVLDDGQIVARQQVHLSLTFDHRVVDGAPAARFLQTIVTAIADPAERLRLS